LDLGTYFPEGTKDGEAGASGSESGVYSGKMGPAVVVSPEVEGEIRFEVACKSSVRAPAVAVSAVELERVGFDELRLRPGFVWLADEESVVSTSMGVLIGSLGPDEIVRFPRVGVRFVDTVVGREGLVGLAESAGMTGLGGSEEPEGLAGPVGSVGDGSAGGGLAEVEGEEGERVLFQFGPRVVWHLGASSANVRASMPYRG